MKMVIENIKRIRKEKGYSHEYIAHELGISQVAYSKLEKKETKLTVERLYKLAELFEINVSELLDINATNQFNQTNNSSSTGYLQQIEHFFQENKEQNLKIVELYELRLKDKDKLIAKLEALTKLF